MKKILRAFVLTCLPSLLVLAALATLPVLPALLATPAAAQEPAIPDQPSDAAMAFVSQFSDAHLTAMLTRIGARQQPMVALSQLHGQMLAAIYDAEVAKSVQKYGKDWQRNMARAWTGLMTDAELASLTADGAASPHSDKYQGLSGAAGQRMQTLSQDLFRTVLAETIQNTMKALGEGVGGEGDGGEAEAGDDGKADKSGETPAAKED